MDALETLKSVGAIITDDHIVYTKGGHGSVYINKDALYPHVRETNALCQLLAKQIEHLQPEVVAAPALGGIVLTQWVAHHLGATLGVPPLAIYADKSDQGLVFKRGYDQLIKGKRVVVLEDIINTGGSVKNAVEVVRASGGEVIGVGVLVNRQPKLVTTDTFTAPLFALLDFPAEIFEAESCPLCVEGRPINTTVGHGKKFLEKKNNKIK